MELPPTTDNKPFRCLECGQPLGYVHRRDNIRYLLVAGDVTIEITGHAYLNCSCGGRREWHPGDVALAELLRMVEERRIQTS